MQIFLSLFPFLSTGFFSFFFYYIKKRKIVFLSFPFIFQILLIFLISELLEILFLQVFNSIYFTWNGRRLVSSLVWLSGFNIYRPILESPLVSGLNGPFHLLAFSPASIAPNPIIAIILACAISITFVLLPCFFLFSLLFSSSLTFLGMILCFSLILYYPGLRLSSFMVHADAPAVGFATLSLVAFFLRERIGKNRAYFLSLLFCLFTAHTKMTFSLVGVGIALALVQRGEKKEGVLFLLSFILGLPLSILFFSWLFGTGYFFHNWFLSAKLPWTLSSHSNHEVAVNLTERLWSLLQVAKDLCQSHELLFFFFLIFLGTYIYQTKKFSLSSAASLKFLPVLFVAIVNIPASLAGRAKAGGDVNTLTPTVFYLMLTTVILFLCFCEEEGGFSHKEWFVSFQNIKKDQKKLSSYFILVLCFFFSVSLFSRIHSLIWPIYKMPCVEMNAYRFAKKYPQQVYFPEYPLATWLADHRLDHSLLAILELQSGKAWKITDTHFRQFLPPKLKWVAIHTLSKQHLQTFLPEFTLPTTSSDLPGFLLLERK